MAAKVWQIEFVDALVLSEYEEAHYHPVINDSVMVSSLCGIDNMHQRPTFVSITS